MEKTIYNTKIFETTITGEDLIDCMDEEVREKFESLPEERQIELLENNQRSIEKGIEAGVMTDWDYVVEIAMDNSGLYKDIESAVDRNFHP